MTSQLHITSQRISSPSLNRRFAGLNELLRIPVIMGIFLFCTLAWIALAVVSPKAVLAALCLSAPVNQMLFAEIPEAYFRYVHASLMTVGMMLPLTIPMLLRYKNFPELRGGQFLMLVFVAVFIANWLGVAMLLEFLLNFFVVEALQLELILITGFFAAAWQSTSYRIEAVKNCKKAPIFERRSKHPTRSTYIARIGAASSADCIKSCLPIMALSSVSGHALLPMIGLTFIIWNERFSAQDYPLAHTVTLIAITLIVAIWSLHG